MTPPSVFIFAGEASADALGGLVMDGLERLAGSSGCWGVGGPAMMRRGFRPVQPMEAFTVLGPAQALASVPRLSRMGGALIGEILERRPDAVLTIDNKGFSMRFARRLRKRMAAANWRAPVLHLVAPTVWAWGGWRAGEVARSVDHLLCLFPFEKRYFADAGIPVTVTGHPAAERARPGRAEARRRLGLAADAKVLVLLPGSRRREVGSLLPGMLEAAATARGRAGPIEVLVPAADAVKDEVAAIAAGHGWPRLLSAGDLDLALAAGDYGLVCSGTVTLEAAIAGLPGSVHYRPDALSRILGGMLVDRGKVVLANAVAGREVYPLFLGRESTPESMAEMVVEGIGIPAGPEFSGIGGAVTVEGGFAANAAGAVMAEIGARG